MKRLLLLSCLFSLCLNTLKAQIDPHFSQYYAYPLWLNPALTGVMDGDARITANFKEQWAGVTNGYKTSAVSGDFRSSDKVALGFNILDQTAGSIGYNYLAAYGSFAYQIAVSDNKFQKVSFGLQAGLVNLSYNASKLQLDNQYNSGTGGFDPTMPSGENFTNANSTVFDSSAGVFYYNGDPESSANVFAGISASHLAPMKNYSAATVGLSGVIPLRYSAHAGVRIRASDSFDITPHAIFIRQQQNQIAAAGMNLEMKFQDEHSLILGGMYRWNDAAVANVGFHLNNTIIGISYDQTTSPLNTAVPQGTYELSISYIFKHRLGNRAQICPRL